MKRIILSLALLGICGMGMAQVQDNAVIPVSVTINSVLRLQVNSGGNIQFVFNTMSQFTQGIDNSTNTTTKFSVSSSRAYTVNLKAEDANLIGITTGAPAPLSLITFEMAGGNGVSNIVNQALDDSDIAIVNNSNPANNEKYDIKWAAGTAAGASATGIAPDTYVTNVFLTLVPN